MSCFLSLSHIYYKYDSAAEPVLNNLSLNFPSGWTGVVGTNGCGKTTLLKIISGIFQPDSGMINKSPICIICEQNVNTPPINAESFFDSVDRESFILRAKFQIQADMLSRWNSLSMGERKKIQIATALHQKPDVMCIDEPTNHLDFEGRAVLAQELANFTGIGVLVSHDRELLDSLCSHCLFMEKNKYTLRSGGITEGLQLASIEIQNKLKERANLNRKLKQSKKELQRRRAKENLAQKRNSKKRLAKGDRAAKERIDAARVTGRFRNSSDAAGAQARQLAKLQDEFNRIEKVKIQKFALSIPYGVYSHKNSLLDLSEGEILLTPSKKLSYPELNIKNNDRIAFTGPNGSGKSTLINKILPELNLAPSDYIYMQQEFDYEITNWIYCTLQSLSHDDFSKVMSIAASLGSRPETLLNSPRCSPGEWRKLFFGLGALRQIKLIIMDEPTNHLDLNSIQCLEQALAECQCAMLLISHDKKFLDQTCKSSWQIERINSNENILRKNIFIGH